MEDLIKQAKMKNGGGTISFSVKEMILGLYEKFDNLPCQDHVKTIQTNKAWVTIFKWLYPLCFVIMSIAIALK